MVKRILEREEKIEELDLLFSRSDYLRNAFRWFPNAGNLEKREERARSLSVGPFEFEEKGSIYYVSLSVSMSYNHTYVKRDYRENSKRITLATLKRVYKEMTGSKWFPVSN